MLTSESWSEFLAFIYGQRMQARKILLHNAVKLTLFDQNIMNAVNVLQTFPCHAVFVWLNDLFRAQYSWPWNTKIVSSLGVPTFKKMSSNLAGWYIFRTIFHEDFKNVNFINVGHSQSTLNFCPCSPHTGLATG